ncbi:MAG: SIR2 family protein [Planctomycetota bacterium]
MTKHTTIWEDTGFLDEFSRMNQTMGDRQFCFFLGSGASVTSGIPAGGELAWRWLHDLYRLANGKPAEDDEALKAWATPEHLGIGGFDIERAATFYGQLYRARFRADPSSAYAYLEDLMGGKQPGFGYSVLAQVLAETRHKVVITTNFDNLASDALSIYTQTTPLICGHEALAGFAQTRLRRPLIAKIHRDLLLSPQNADDEIDKLPEPWQTALARLLTHFTPIFIGYGGNDPSVMNFLASLDPGRIEGGVYWVYRRTKGAEQPYPDAAVELVRNHGGALVAATGFDELMFLLHQRLELDFLDDHVEQVAHQRADDYRKQRDALVKGVRDSPEDDQKAEKAAIRRITDTPKTWWEWELKAQSESDPEKCTQVYRDAIRAMPESAELIGNFALFTHEVRKDYAEAERLYQRALELEPDIATNIGNFALFTHEVRKDYAEAERLYQRALEIDPKNAAHTNNLAVLLEQTRKDYERTERLYRRSLELDPEHAHNTGNFAGFLLSRHRWEEAEAMIEKAWTLDVERDSQSTGDRLICGLLLDARSGRAVQPVLGRLKTLIGQTFMRGIGWSLDAQFEAVADTIDADDLAFYRKIADAVLDEEKVAALEADPRWRQIEPVALDGPRR